MSPDETPDTPETEPEATEAAATEPEATEPAATEPEATGAEEAPKRRRRSRKKPAEPTVLAAERSGEDGDEDGVDETPEDILAEEAAADVMLEADAEAEGEDEDETEAEAEADEEALADLEPEPDEEQEEEQAPPPAPAPGRRRRGAGAERRDVVVRAQAKYVRSSARKARLVCDHIRGKTVEEARAILAHTSRAVARDWSKLLESAVANAENNHELVGEDLYIKAVHADEGPTIRRFRPRAMGRATRIRKRTSHLTILLTPKD
jgi:ribosomal protein L22